MKANSLMELLTFSIENGFPVLIKGKPGIGKSDIVAEAVKAAKAHLIISHPVVSDPTDFKGLPANVNGKAQFLPFGELEAIIEAKEKTVYFLDDLGQAPASVQAACMQLILAKSINGHKVSDKVVFVAATNRKEDKAAVSGILEPVKSRFATIVELEVDIENWITWAIKSNLPSELPAFIRFRPELLNSGTPTRDIVNTPSPRTVASIGKMLKKGLPEKLQFEVFKGAAGEGFAAEFLAFLRLYKELPSIQSIINNPNGTPIPENPATLYALSGAIAANMKGANIAPLCKFLIRIPVEIQVACVKDAASRNKDFLQTEDFSNWANNNAEIIL